MTPTNLPVEEILDTLKQRLREHHEVVLEAPPGAGKTTLVPLALMHEPWLAGKKVVMLEPRRIAARSAAYRMASLLNESPGESVGYRMRMDTRIGRNTKVEVITEGILTRKLQQDPALEDVGLVIFDEFHERSLESDLALALCLKGRLLFREAQPLKILVMSATLDSSTIAKMLGDAPVIKSEGRAYPVEIIHGQARLAKERIVDRVVATIKQALDENPDSSLLAFLPGQGEIHRATETLSSWLLDNKIPSVQLRPLFGNLSMQEQQAAIAPLAGTQSKERKVVLATNIAETSLTIEGVDVVVDSGLVREPRFDPVTGMSGLHTVKISSASSVQRAGRAGRLRPGKCYRLWSAHQQQQLAAHGSAEILQADLAPLALQLLQWGVDDPAELDWLDAPPTGPWCQALDLLESLGATETRAAARVLTAHGLAMASLPVHPRLAHLLVCGASMGIIKPATLLASLLSDRNPLSHDNPDIGHHLDVLNGDAQCPSRHQGWLHRTRQLARQFEQHLLRLDLSANKLIGLLKPQQVPGYLLACAYPDRIAHRRHAGGYQLANGRSARLVDQHHLGNSQWLAVAEVSSIAGAKGDTVRSASALDHSLFASALEDLVSIHTVAEWDSRSGRFIAEQQQKTGALIVQKKPLDTVPLATKTTALLEHIKKQGLTLLPWKKENQQWCSRVSLLRSVEGEKLWPDVSQDALLADVENWLGPYLDKVNQLQDFSKLKLQGILDAMLPWEIQQRLNRLAPTRLKVPSGSSHAIDYTQSPPVLAVKLQEMFGCEESPTVADGKVTLLVHLLSPAGRPLQITQDLAGFWRSSYYDVKKDMKGRYPKHPWPDDPLVATATRKTKARG